MTLDMNALIQSLHPLERAVLAHLKDSTTYRALTNESGMQEVEVMRALQWLENKEVLTLNNQNTTFVQLDSNGQEIFEQGLPEKRFLQAVQQRPGSVQDIAKAAQLNQGVAGACVGILKKAKCIDMQPDKTLTITAVGKNALNKPWVEETFIQKIGKAQLDVSTLTKAETQILEQFKQRKNILKLTESKDRLVKLTKLGKALLKEKLDVNYAERLTSDDLKTGAWKEKQYRAYDVALNVPARTPGKPHFVNEAIEYIRSIWLELGFSEMQGNMMDTALWDLDSLFIPQDHPAREMQDTFYVDAPLQKETDIKLLKSIKAVHENGADTGSTGWQYTFSIPESEQLMLRTHTTVLSAQTLDAIHKGNAANPGKYFVVGPVFRNEDLDWKHLFEFHQVEGIVVDESANFTHLLGYLELFFKKLGYEKVRVRPAHFPYTEPSVEVDGWHPTKKQWVELGGAGMFRPEVTKTLIGKETPVLAWGLGMERGISEYFGITDIRQLYDNDIKRLREQKKWVK